MAANGEVNGNGKAPAVDISAEDAEFSWLDAHPVFVIILVGEEEKPFGIQKDFLCAKSRFFRERFMRSQQEQIEHVVELPQARVEVFACAQNYMYTGEVFPNLDSLPSFDVLIGVWKLGHELGIAGLCDRTLDAMTECRRITRCIPATPLMVQVWASTPEGSSIRRLLLEWAAEYMRESEDARDFAQSLPKEILSELVVAMSTAVGPLTAAAAAVAAAAGASPTAPGNPLLPSGPPGTGQRKNVHYRDVVEGEDDDAAAAGPSRPAKKARSSDVLPNGLGRKPAPAPKKQRASLPAVAPKPAPQKRRTTNNSLISETPYSTDKKLNFCADLLSRMLSGPGFWTRLVGPFREPVDPIRDEVPDYHQRINKPMDLGTMKDKMDRREYANEEDFLKDMHQIFTNCYTYWDRKSPMWMACEKLEKTFEEKYSQMNKWISKMEGVET